MSGFEGFLAIGEQTDRCLHAVLRAAYVDHILGIQMDVQHARVSNAFPPEHVETAPALKIMEREA